MASAALKYKYLSLAVLVLQTTTMVLVLRYSRTVPVDGPRYISSTAIVVSESLKILICLIIIHHEEGSITKLISTLRDEVANKPYETSKLLVPASLYAIQNNLLFLALTNLDAATYQVTYQMKILTTALCSVGMLHKRLALTQWFSLVLLMVGVSLVQWPSTDDSKSVEIKATIDTPKEMNRLIGLAAVLASCFLSGFTGVYFEKLVKYTSQSLWIRSIQLAIFGFLFSLLAVIVQDYDKILKDGFFQGYNTCTWIVIVLQACGGLIVGLVMKYADNILKGFATSVSIVLSTLLSYYLLADFEPSTAFLSGASVVIFSTFVYSF
jgi:UDP-sugar transporter A1/2/3